MGVLRLPKTSPSASADDIAPAFITDESSYIVNVESCWIYGVHGDDYTRRLERRYFLLPYMRLYVACHDPY